MKEELTYSNARRRSGPASAAANHRFF